MKKYKLAKDIKYYNLIIIWLTCIALVNLRTTEIESNSTTIITDTKIHVNKSNCGERIQDPTDRLSKLDNEEICNLLNMRNDVFMFIRLIPDLEEISKRGINSNYDIDNEKYCNVICESHGVCSTALGITVYYEARKIRISARKNIEKIINSRFRNNMIDLMKTYLKTNDFFKAFKESINRALDEFKYKKYGIYKKSHYFSAINHKKPNENHVKSNDDSGAIFGLIFFFVLIILICYCCVIGSAVKPHNKIHEHFEHLNDLIHYEIKTKLPPITTTNKCLLCFEYLNKPFQNQQTAIPSIIMFSCGHYFHEHCITAMINPDKAGDYCMMCDEPTAAVNKFTSLSETGDYNHHVSEKNVANILGNFNNIYGENALKGYYESYSHTDVKQMSGYSTQIWWINHVDYAPQISPSPSNQETKFSSWETSGGDYGDYGNTGGDYGTSGGDY